MFATVRKCRWALLLIALVSAGAALAGEDKPQQVLIFHLATGFVHDSIPDGVAAVRRIATDAGLQPFDSADPAVFDKPLTDVAAVVLVSTTSAKDKPESEWFTGARGENFKRYVEGGGGIVAIHAAADSHYGWPWYGQAIGARFAHHPKGTPVGKVVQTNVRHASRAAGVPQSFTIPDEWYWFEDVAPELDHLLTLDPKSIGAVEDNPRPLAWAHSVGKGRVFYTGLGHRRENWQDPRVIAHVAGGLRWAAARVKAPSMVIVDERTKRVREAPPHGRIGMGTAWRITDGLPGRTMEFRKRTLDRGAAIGIHPIAHDEVYHVVSGEGEVTSDGVTRRLTPGMTAYLYNGAQVGIRQSGREPLALIISYPLAEPAP